MKIIYIQHFGGAKIAPKYKKSPKITNVTNANKGTPRQFDNIDETDKSSTIKPLPDIYVTVPPSVFRQASPTPPKKDGNQDKGTLTEREQDKDNIEWLETVHKAMSDDGVIMENISWSAHFANLQQDVRPAAITALLPLFSESAHSLAMVKHSMDLIQRATSHVNPGQVPVITLDQPLYAIAKKIQWSWPDTYGDKSYVVMMGGLHTEMAFLAAIGNWLSGSGWSTVMSVADVTTEGRSDYLLKGHETSTSQWAHQVTAAALYHLMVEAYAQQKDDQNEQSFDEWRKDMEGKKNHFYYWSKVLDLEMLFLKFLKSEREGSFQAYVEALEDMIPWLFVSDHYHYARWLSVHVQDLKCLQINCPAVHDEFLKGNFVTQKTNHKFSLMPHDQIHEQLNAVVKGDGGVIGLTENDPAMKRWMVAGPEISRIIKEYEDYCNGASMGNSDKHHEQTKSIQTAFRRDVKHTITTFNDMGNPFLEDATDVFSLDTKVIMSPEAVSSMKTAANVGKSQYETFVKEKLLDNPDTFYDTISKHSLQLFKAPKQCSSKSKSKESSLKQDLGLFSRMYVAC